MEKESRKHNVMDSLLPTKILRKSPAPTATSRPKSCEYSDLCSEFYGIALSRFSPEGVDNGWDDLIGHPVCISGVKQGILRYYGRTKFADGLWCGIELDEPVGKNDGMVNGIRYFYCKPNRGIFAPVTKVSLLPPMSSKRHSITDDQNFYRKHELMKQTACSDLSFLKQSSSDPTFQRKRCSRNCPECLENSAYLGDKRAYTEQRDLNVVGSTYECDGWCKANCSIPPKSIESHTLPYASNNSKNMPLETHSLEKRKQTQHIQIANVFGLEHKRLDYMSFPRKVMSEYAISARANHITLTQSRSCPHTSQGLKGLDAEGHVHGIPVKQDKIPFREAQTVDHLAQKDSIPKDFNPSLEFLDVQDDKDEDQLSLDYDESLGILTPSEMKDFTLCADLPTSYSDTRAVDFPSSESFDDVNDLPEDEQVQEPSMQYIPSSGSSTFVPTDIARSQHTNLMLQELQYTSAPNKHVVTSTDRFFSSISSGNVREVHLSSDYASYLKHNSVAGREQDVFYSNLSGMNELETGVCLGASDAKVEMSKPLLCADDGGSFVGSVEVGNAQSIAKVKPTSIASLHQRSMDSQNPRKIRSTEQHCEDEVAAKRFYDTESSRDSLLHDQEHSVCKEKLTVSWEDCVAECTDEMFNKVERPESVYTVGSNDTGFQEDGEFDTGMTTSMESSEEYKRFSTVSRDSCVPVEDLEADKVAESTSTSGYSTGLSDSCSNDRRDDGSRNIMDDSFQDVADACNSDDAQDGAFDVVSSSQISEKADGFFDMDSCKDTESASEFHITESSTVLGLDSTSDTLCETIMEKKEYSQLPDGTSESAADHDQPVANGVGEKLDLADGASISKSARSSRAATAEGPQTPESPSKRSLDRKTPKAEKQNPSSGKKASQATSTKDKGADYKKLDTKSPKRNVMSKIKAVIGGSSSKTASKSKSENTEQNSKKPAVAKKSRWEAVTSKIAASLAEEKAKPKAKKDVKSRVDTNLTAARLCRSPKLDSSSASENKADVSVGSSSSSKSKKEDRHRNVTRRECKQAMQLAGIERDSKSPRPCKTCSSSRSTSPVAASESSTSVSYTSHQSRSKIAVWKGSNSTVASSVPPIQTKKLQDNASLRSATVNSRYQVSRDGPKGSSTGKLRSSFTNTGSPCTTLQRSNKGDAPSKTPGNIRSKGVKEQGNTPRPLVAPRPVRPPMWLSKAELTQEIQHLSSLCESRTKELNRLRMESKKVTTGFDALAVVIHYMTTDLKAFQNPNLVADLKQLEDKLKKGKEELARYEAEIEKLKCVHAEEMKVLSEKMEEDHEGNVQQLVLKHELDIRKLKEQHEKEMESLTDALRASCEEEKLQNAKMIDDLKKELIKQREEMEIFHQHELDDLEERHLEKQKALKAELDKLQQQYDEAKQLSQNMEDALQKDTDAKLQWLTSKRHELQNEVDSLKAVLEIKNNELHSLRKENLEMHKELEELPIAREKIKMLQARAEDLQALMNEKVKVERQLSTEHQTMKETYEREAKINKRLSMENEELLWRLKQLSESSLMTVPIADEPETDNSSELSVSCPPAVCEHEAAPSSPAKSPRRPTESRPVFFTYMNQEELNALSPGSPRTQYKRIQPSPASQKSPSPAKQFKSPSRPGSRRSRGSLDVSPQRGGKETPRKSVRRANSLRDASTAQQNKACPSDEKARNGNSNPTPMAEPNVRAVQDSMVSSASSENSVFEPCLLEDHSEEICASLRMLEQQRTADFILDVSSLSCNSKGEWQVLSEIVDNQRENVDQEHIDPKTYYHMTFPARDSVQDVDSEDLRKETEKLESFQIRDDSMPVDE